MSGIGRSCYDRYQHQGASEWLLRIGEASARPLLFLPPMFEEMNRTRALLAGVMRRLAAEGFGCWLPDLPGTGESEQTLESCGWEQWRGAVRSVASIVETSAGRPALSVAVRGGALLDDTTGAAGFWRLTPVAGASLIRDLERSTLVTAADQAGTTSILAGYPLSEPLVEAIRAAIPAPVTPLRMVRLTSDSAEADVRIAGPALWRRSEPGNSPELITAIVSDIRKWALQCAAC